MAKKTGPDRAQAAGDTAAEITGTGGTALRKKDLVAAVTAASGVKAKVAKPVVEAVLAELARLLVDGKTLVLPPLGRLSVNRSRGPDADVMILKLKRPKPAEAHAGDGSDDEPDAAEDSAAEPVA